MIVFFYFKRGALLNATDSLKKFPPPTCARSDEKKWGICPLGSRGSKSGIGGRIPETCGGKVVARMVGSPKKRSFLGFEKSPFFGPTPTNH